MNVYRVTAAPEDTRCDVNGCTADASCAEDTGGDELYVCPDHCEWTHGNARGHNLPARP